MSRIAGSEQTDAACRGEQGKPDREQILGCRSVQLQPGVCHMPRMPCSEQTDGALSTLCLTQTDHVAQQGSVRNVEHESKFNIGLVQTGQDGERKLGRVQEEKRRLEEKIRREK